MSRRVSATGAAAYAATLTPPSPDEVPPPYINPPADFTEPQGWSCEEFPCEDDIPGFLERIRVPPGYSVEHVGQFPGQPMQITYGPDGRLYATVLLDGTRNGTVLVMNADGSTERYTRLDFISPVGLAFQPGTDVLYVSARLSLENGGVLWRLLSDGTFKLVLDDLPCCFSSIDNQPNGMTFGPDGFIYLGVGSLTDHLESDNPRLRSYTDLHPLEASLLRIQPDTGEIVIYAQGIRNPYDVAFDSAGQFYVTDNGLVEGPGDRILAIEPGAHYGWPYWRTRGCAECPIKPAEITVSEDLLRLPDYTLPRGLTVYTGSQFPRNMSDSIFVALWNGTPHAQRIVRIVPDDIPTDPELLAAYEPEPFMTGLIRPVDVTVAPDGSLVVADFVYGHVWRVRFDGVPPATQTPTPAPTLNRPAATQAPVFVTATPRP